MSRVVGARDGEEDFVVQVIKTGQAQKIGFEILFHAFRRTNQGYTRCIKAELRAQAPTNHFQPFKPVPQTVKALQELFDEQKIENRDHGRRISKIDTRRPRQFSIVAPEETRLWSRFRESAATVRFTETSLLGFRRRINTGF